jgi:predicted DNA binding protein
VSDRLDPYEEAPTAPREERAMIRARFRLDLPEGLWVGEVSRTHPDATLRLLTGVPLDDRSLELGEVRGPDPRAVADDIRAHPAVPDYDLLYADGERALARYETTEQALFDFLGGSSLPPEFPLTVAAGVMEFTVTATRAQFERLGDRLDAGDRRYELLSVVHAGSREGVLTARQRECLEVALRKGYFEVPRDCTLAAVAAALDVDTSTASETLRRGSARILDWFFVDPT